MKFVQKCYFAIYHKLMVMTGKIKMEKFVYGLVVDFPLKFLSHEENFFPDIVTAEGIVPSEIWI
ncbi:hypothetical protein BpHYR1_007813 [Brachionus plicatilis]|uniref:Uncharacterized protein n=1 Tax=Brachionus plicatilis TaxID=10195 RepID=A0A3M7QHW5_BRAPC|nr:hypothetical protein BpHYR1_007813 [Brachionus plicatilis]